MKICRLLPKLDTVKRLQNSKAKGHYIVIITGRWNLLEDITHAWLKFYDVPYHLMAMRREEDWDKMSVDIKMSAYDDLVISKIFFDEFPVTWIDDDIQMLNAVKKNYPSIITELVI